jgi:hypothetical protein
MNGDKDGHPRSLAERCRPHQHRSTACSRTRWPWPSEWLSSPVPWSASPDRGQRTCSPSARFDLAAAASPPGAGLHPHFPRHLRVLHAGVSAHRSRSADRRRIVFSRRSRSAAHRISRPAARDHSNRDDRQPAQLRNDRRGQVRDRHRGEDDRRRRQTDNDRSVNLAGTRSDEE